MMAFSEHYTKIGLNMLNKQSIM